MPVYPVRLDEKLYQRLCERAQRENCSVAALLRTSADAAAGSPSIDTRLFSIHEELAKLSCSIDTNRILLAFLAAYLSRGNIDRRELEKILADHDTAMSNRRLRHIKFNETLRKIARDFPHEGGGKNK